MQQTILKGMISLYYKLNLMYATYITYSYRLTFVFLVKLQFVREFRRREKRFDSSIEDLRYQLSTSQEQLLVSEQKIKESEVHNN